MVILKCLDRHRLVFHSLPPDTWSVCTFCDRFRLYSTMEFIELILIPKLDGVILKYPNQDIVDGTLCITGHHLILSSRKEGARELWLLHNNMDWVEKRDNKAGGGSLYLRCKDLRVFRLDIAGTRDLAAVHQSLENLSRLTDPCLLYPFFYRPMYPIMENGYTLYGTESEFAKVLATEEWRVSRANQTYAICDTYSAAVVVPRSVPDDCLITAATFRQGGRFPVLAYRHNNGAVLMRAGQPLYGSKRRRCRQDERILNAVVGSGQKGVVYDLRSANLITQQQNKGGGTESSSNYSQWKIYNRAMDEVDQPQQLLDSLTKLLEACNDEEISTDKWLTKLEAGGWLESVRNSLHTACIVAQHLHQKGEPVLIHGTKGQDATLLVSSLVQIILNPDCRTVRGLQALVEREWLQAGHAFGTRHRCGAQAPAPAPGAAPVFLLFLDCVRQFLEQFPCTFEFLQSLLVTLFEHSYSSQYGTFLGDSEQQRRELGVPERTTSVWSWLNRPEELAAHLNPLYEPTPSVIWPSVAPMSLVLWDELFLRRSVWVEQQTAERVEQVRAMKTREQALRSQAAQLRRELLELAQEYYRRSGDRPAPAQPASQAASKSASRSTAQSSVQ